MRRSTRMSRPTLSGSSRSAVLLGNDGDGSTLTLDFTTGQLDPRLTFTRASNATFINSSGLVQWAANNMVIRSQDYTNSAWSKFRIDTTSSGLNVANTTLAPDGSNTGLLLKADAATGTHRVLQSNSTTGSTFLSNNGFTIITLSAFFKANGSNFAALKISNNIESRGVTRTFNLTDGVVSGVEDATWVCTNASATSVGNGWYRCQITASISRVDANDDQLGMWLFVANGAGTADRSFTNSSASVWAWGAQAELASSAGGYNATTTATYQAPRFDHDPTTLAPRGLLIEGTATSLSRSSQNLTDAAYWTLQTAYASTSATGGTAPDGTNTGNLFTEPSSNLQRSIYQSYSSAAGTYTFSVWLKAGSGSTRYMRLVVTSGTGDFGYVTVNMSTGAIQQAATVVGTATNASATVSGNYTATGWRRYSLTVTLAASVNFVFLVPTDLASIDTPTTNYGRISYLGDGSSFLIWGAQLEAGSGASSYIPTGASTVQRLADFCTIPTSSFITGPLYPQTLFVECIPANPSAAFPDIVRLFDRTAGGTFSYGTELYYYGSSTMTVQRKTNASTNSDRPLASGLAYNSRHKVAVAVDSSAFLGSYDGLTGSGATTAPPALASQVTHMGIGCTGEASAASVMFGTIRQIKFFPFAMAQSQLNTLTTL